MMINVNDLFLFAKVIESGSFTAAAERTGFPKSTLSRRIVALEETLGERLINRNTRRISITDFGQAVLEHAHVIVKESENVSDLANFRQITPSGRLKISMPPNLSEFVNPCFFPKFIHDHPKIAFELDFSNRKVDIIAEGFDLAIRMAPSLADDAVLVARPIKKMEGGIYASPDYLKRKGIPKNPEELENHIGIHLADSLGALSNWQLDKGKERWIGVPKSPVVTNSIEMIRLLTTQGIGIAPFASVFVKTLVDQGKLVRILDEWSAPTVTMWAVTPGRKLLPTKTQVFLKAFKEALI